MPYALPASPSTTVLSSTRQNHRRSRSSFSDEQGPGAFVSLGVLPKRRPAASKKPLFHLNPDDSPPEDHNDDDDDDHLPAPVPQPPTMRFSNAAYPVLNSLKGAKDSGRFSPSVQPPTHIDLPMSAPPAHAASFRDQVPFPTSSPLPSPNAFNGFNKFRISPLIPSPSSASSLPRTPSTPVILSNGKQLKSSLKSSSSSPNIPDLLRTKHLRAQSAPSTPNMHKNVHFAENGLESVCLFNRTGKPMSVSKPAGDETETETEPENPNTASGFPFPSSVGPSVPVSSSSPQNLVHEIDTAPHMTSAVPSPSPSPLANVHLETVTLPRTRPPTLRGTVLVRNLHFEKLVAVRFTLDDWQTTSEVLCKHVVSLPGLPPPFPRYEPRRVDVDDVASKIVSGTRVEEDKGPTWDRFSFTIRLEDYEAKLADRTLFLVARFGCPSGEWWDNNDHRNYRVGFRKATANSLSPLATPVPSAFQPLVKDGEREKDGRGVVIPSVPQHLLTPTSQQRSFSAPNTLRYTPMTGTLAGIPIVSLSSKSSLAAPMLMRTMSSPYPPSSQPMDDDSPSSSKPLQHTPRPTSPTARETAARTSSYISRRLSLSNYVAPGNSPTEERKDVIGSGKTDEARGLVTPPNTPPGTIRFKGVGLPASPPRRPSPPPVSTDEKDLEEVDVKQLDEDIGEIPSEVEEDDDDTPKEEKGLHLDTSSLPFSTPDVASPSPQDELLPFSPTSVKVSHKAFLPFNQGGYLSPPTSRDASEDGGSGEAGRSSPATGTPPSEPATTPSSYLDDVPSVQHRPSPLVLPSLGLNFQYQHMPAESEFEDGDTPNGRVDTSDSSYAAFVRQWCFAQSAPPTPGVHSASSSASPRNQASSSQSPAGVHLSGKQPQQPWLGIDAAGNGYGFPGFNFGAVNQDVGMVRAHLR